MCANAQNKQACCLVEFVFLFFFVLKVFLVLPLFFFFGKNELIKSNRRHSTTLHRSDARRNKLRAMRLDSVGRVLVVVVTRASKLEYWGRSEACSTHNKRL